MQPTTAIPATSTDPPIRSGPEARRILAPVLLGDGAEVSTPDIAIHARAMDAEVIVLRVLGSRASDAADVSLEEALARTHLDAVTAELRAAGTRAQPLLRYGNVVAAVQDAAREHRVSMIVVGRQGRNRVGRLLAGDHAAEIARQAPCPVLVVESQATTTRTALRRFDEDVLRAGPVAPRFLGVRTVHVARIVGAVTRAADLDLDFRPRRRRESDAAHYRQVLKTMERGAEKLPPVDLYKLGYGYYAYSGHAQIAAAKELGQSWIESVVTEYVPMAAPDVAQVLDERAAFERTTGLDRVGAARAGTYPALAELIERFATHYGIGDVRAVATRWYAAIFRPAQRLVRERRLGEHFPGERSADILLRAHHVMQWRNETRREELTWQEAILALAADPQQERAARQHAA